MNFEEAANRVIEELGPFDELRINHHWVPITYLAAFTDTQRSDGTFYLYDRNNIGAEPRPVHPVSVAKERGLYLAEYVDGKAADVLERFFARHVEGPFSVIRDKLVFGPSVGITPTLDRIESLQLAFFIAVQQGRTPARRDEAQWMASFHHTFDARAQLEDIPRTRKEYERRTGKTLSGRAIRQWRRDFDNGRLEVRPGSTQPWLSTFLRNAEHVAAAIVGLPTRLLRAPVGVRFPASDNPVVLCRREPGDLVYRLGAGWSESICEATVALSADVVLVIGPNVENDRSVGTREWHESVVERTTAHSDRFVFAPQPDKRIPELLSTGSAPKPVLEYEGVQYSLDEPIGPIVAKVLKGTDTVLRFGHADNR